MCAVLPRKGGVAGQQKDDRAATRIVFLVEFKDNALISSPKPPLVWPPVEPCSIHKISFVRSHGLYTRVNALQHGLILECSVHFARIRGIGQHALNLGQDADIMKFDRLISVEGLMEISRFDI